MEDASHPSCDWKWAFFGHQQRSNPLICFNATQASSMVGVAEPVPALGVPPEEQQEQIHTPEGGQARSCGWPQWPPPGRTKATTASAGNDQIRRDIESGAGSILQIQSETAEDGTRDKSTQNTCHCPPRSWGWRQELPRPELKCCPKHGQRVQGWGWLGQLGPFSSSGPWQLHRGKCKQKCPGEGGGIKESGKTVLEK